MGNYCDICINVIGDEKEIAKAEDGLKAIFIYDDWDDHRITADPLKNFPEGVRYRLCYKYGLPVNEMAELFESHPSLIFMVGYSDLDSCYHGTWVYAYGRHVAAAEGEYCVDPGMEEVEELPDFFGRFLDSATRPTPEQIRAEYPESTEAERTERRRWIEEWKAEREAGWKKAEEQRAEWKHQHPDANFSIGGPVDSPEMDTGPIV
jgi:hypothetical protein